MQDVYYALLFLIIVISISLAVVWPIFHIMEACNPRPVDLAPGDVYTVTDNNRTMLSNVLNGVCMW